MLLILPVIAVVAAIAPLVPPLVKILRRGSVETETTQRSKEEMVEMATQRQLHGEHEKLLQVGFLPMGTNWSQIGSEGNRDGEHDLVFHHLERPFAASLSVLPDGQRNVAFFSGDLSGRVLVTTSLEAGGLNTKTEQGWYQTFNTSNFEEVFEMHVQANDEWTLQGFTPQRIETTQQFDQVVLEQFNMPAVRQMAHAFDVLLGLGSLVFSLFFPAVITAIATFLIGDWSWLSPVNFFSITSLLGSAVWYFGVTTKVQREHS